MKRTEDDTTNQSTQLTLLSAAEITEMRRPAAPRLREGQKTLHKVADGRKARPAEGRSVQLRLPGF